MDKHGVVGVCTHVHVQLCARLCACVVAGQPELVTGTALRCASSK